MAQLQQEPDSFVRYGLEETFRRAEILGPLDMPILIQGETGTGKEYLARHIHKTSGRSGDLVIVSGAELPEGLAESLLFGHVKGAFTSGDKQNAGTIMQAHEGTFFLDEIGELSGAVQAKLLRVLENGEIRPIGANKTTHVDVRFIAATSREVHRDKNGGFRRDLLNRFQPLNLPPLRNRPPEAIVALAKHFIQIFGRGKTFSEDALALITMYGWPGNVRELSKLIERICLFNNSPIICADDIKKELSSSVSSTPSQRGSIHAIENCDPSAIAAEVRALTFRGLTAALKSALAVQLIKSTSGNVSEAGRIAGKNSSNFRRMLNAGDGADDE